MPAPPRFAYLDAIRVIVIAGVIAGHAWGGYDEIGGWAYTDVREVSLAPLTETVAEVVLGPFALFAMGFLFLVAGLLTPGSVGRKGPGRFARGRLLRLGVPLLVFTFVLWPPITAFLAYLGGTDPGPVWSWFTHALRSPDPAQMWFVEVLLLFSLGYAAVAARLRPVHPTRLTAWHLVILALVITVGSFVVRIWFPLDSSQYADLQLSQWPQFLALFVLGVAGARRGWLAPVPARFGRGCGWAALAGVAGIGAIAVVVAATGVPKDDFLGGPHPAALATAAAEGVLAATVPIWLLGLAQRHLKIGAGLLARSSFAAFVVQGHVLVLLAVALRWLAVPAEVKATIVALLGVVLCFALGALLVRRTVLNRIL